LEDGQDICTYCLYASDMNLEWVNYIQKKEEKDEREL
jgi:hypothetical protein